MNRTRSSSALLFLIGLGSVTQFHLVGSLGLSELPMFLLAPFIFILDYRRLSADGFAPFIWLLILTCFGCLISSHVNDTPDIFLLKGLAHPYAMFSAAVIFHRLLRNNFGGLKWFVIGAFLSGIISIFIFQQETYTAGGGYLAEGTDAINRVMGYSLFWSGKIKEVLTLPVKAAYLSVPTAYSAGVGVFLVALTMVISSGSGRSAALTILASTVLIAIARRSRLRMERIGKHIIIVGICSVVALGVLKAGYSFAAREGLLGYEAQRKYLKQTRMGDSALKILMAGRMEFFCGVMACLDHPILGFGPKGEDTGGYVERYLREYGAQEDYEHYVADVQWRKSRGELSYMAIPAHSYIGMFWISYGIVGLLLWLYVLGMFFMYLRKYASAIPQWYGYVVLGLTAESWHIFFSPFASRFQLPLLICCILFCKAVKKGMLTLPMDMEMEARKFE